MIMAVLFPPLPRQLTRRRRCQHGLAKALEDRRHAIKPLAAGLDSSEGGVELGGDAALFAKRRKRHTNKRQLARINIGKRDSCRST